MSWKPWLGVRRGSWVEVLSPQEIRATLDERGTIEGMPFMPEMLQYCGRRFRVQASAHKTCDTVNKTGIRSVPYAVHLEELRCDGGGHGGCQAACLLFWRTEWLKPVSGPSPSPSTAPAPGATTEMSARLAQWSLRSDPPEGATDGPYYRCQATDLLVFAHPARWYHIRLYLRDLWSGNASIGRAIRVLAIGMFNMLQRKRGGVEYPSMYRESWLTRTPSEQLHLQAGEMVRVKPKEQILATLDSKLKNRGLSFDMEMTPYCGKAVRVTRRVERLLDERSGRMLEMPRDCIMLDGVVCLGDLSHDRRMCPRAIPAYWREIWLERVEDAPGKS